MNRPEVTANLSKMLENHIDPHNDARVYWAKEVTFDYASFSPVRVDYMRFKPVNNTVSGIEKGDFYCYEIKSSVEDFKSKNGHNFIGDFNYYVMTNEVFEIVREYIPHFVGVLVPDGRWMKSIKNAKRADRKKPLYEMLTMMYRSARRDLMKTTEEQP